MDKKLKSKVTQWCRYWHFNVTGVLSDNDGHRNYINVVQTLDDWFDTDAFNESGDMIELDESWKSVLANINKCDFNQLTEIKRYCTSKKD